MHKLFLNNILFFPKDKEKGRYYEKQVFKNSSLGAYNC